MKKTLALILAVLLLCLALLPACTPANADGVDTEIKKAYFDKHKEEYERSNERLKEYAPDAKPYTYEDIELERVYTNGGFYALFIDSILYMYATEERREVVSDYEFIYPDYQTMEIYCKGEFYELKDAYEQGVLNSDDLKSVLDAYKEMRPYCYTEEIHGDSQKKVIYYHNGDAILDRNTDFETETVAGLDFMRGKTHTLKFSDGGNECSIAEAYAQGLVTEEELADIHSWYLKFCQIYGWLPMS